MRGDRVFRWFLRLLPFDFRSDYGRDVEQVFREQRREASRLGAASVVRVWVQNVGGVLAIGPREHWAQLAQDVRYALRGMRANPGFVTTAVLTLALGIGANTAIFGIVHAVLLAPLPYADADRLLAVTNRWGATDGMRLSDPEYLDYAEQSRTLDIAAAATGSVNLRGRSPNPERVAAGYVTGNMLAVLGVTPTAGRPFDAREDTPGTRSVLIAHAWWQREFGGDPSAIGQTVQVDGEPHEIVGVLPASFMLPQEFASAARIQVLLPLGLDRAAPRNKRGGHYLSGIARLRADASPAAAAAEMDAIIRPLIAQYPEEHNQGPNFRIDLTRLRDAVLGDARPALLFLAGAVGLVLLVACANVANLLLARGESRRRELAVRTALGASRFRIARQLLTEACVLSAAGAAAGLLVAAWLQQLVRTLAPALLPRLDQARLDGPVLLFTLAIALLTAILFGMVPAFQTSRVDTNSTLKEGGRSAAAGARPRARRAIVVCEVAMALVLLVAAGLLTRSFARVAAVPSGLDPAGVLTLRVSLPESRYPGRAQIVQFFSRLLEQVRSLPGVARAGAGSGLPLAFASGDWGFDIEGRPRVNGRRPGRADWYVVTPGYFETLGISLVRGRYPAESDSSAAPPVLVVNETVARELFPSGDAVGKRVRLSSSTGGEQPWRTIVGIVRDVRTRGLDTPLRTEMFIPYEQFQHFSAGAQARDMTIVVKSAGGDPLGLANSVRAELAAIDGEVAAAQVRDMQTIVSGATADRRLYMVLVGALGLLALVLAAIGLYGVIAFQVAQRTREMGVRLALGATRSNVLALVVTEGLWLAGIGVAAGTLAALLVARPIAALLFGTSPRDLAVFLSAPVILGAVALLACYIPALRATRVDPVIALRAD